MTKGTATGIHLTMSALTATGLVLFWMVFLAAPPDIEDGEFFAVEQTGQALATEIHILTGPALIFLVGLVWGSHVWNRIRNGFTARRRTGIALTVLFPLLALSGYLLQLASDEGLRALLGWGHAVFGVLFAGIYVAHLCVRPPPPITIDAFLTQTGSPEREDSDPTRSRTADLHSEPVVAESVRVVGSGTD